MQAYGITESNRHIQGLEGTTDVNGEVDFGWVLYGSYRLPVELPNGLRSVVQQVTLRAGQELHHTISCPASTQRTQDFQISMPERINGVPISTDTPFWFCLSCVSIGEPLTSRAKQTLGLPYGADWYTTESEEHQIWIGPTGTHVGSLEPAQVDLQTNEFGEWKDDDARDLSRFPCQVFQVPDSITQHASSFEVKSWNRVKSNFTPITRHNVIHHFM